MDAVDVLMYGNRTFMGTLEDLDLADWDRRGVCGVWSVKDIVAHLASHELFLVDVLRSLLENRPPETLEARRARDFNDVEVEKRSAMSAQEVLSEYQEAYQQSAKLIAQVPVEQRRKKGQIEWYGQEYDLEDFLAYGFYGHKREHSAQINVYKDLLKEERGAG
jgi:uncharacterized damage-inducible protein DinB